MKTYSPIIAAHGVEDVILFIRGRRVMLDRDLANLYGVTTSNLNKAVQRNRERFPGDFMFQLTAGETESLIFQSGTSKKRGGSRHFPHAFTQEGIAMLSSVLRSKRALQVNIAIMRAFIKLREVLGNKQQLARKLAALESELKSRLDVHESAIVDVLRRIMRVLDPPPLPPEPAPPEIGFHIKEDAPPYRIEKKTAKRHI
jgi:hypothetical protein